MNVISGIENVTVSAKKSNNCFLYYSCKICGTASSYDKIKEHVERKHRSADPSALQFGPSFKRFKRTENSQSGLAVSSTVYQCIYCDTSLSYLHDIAEHVKHAHNIVHKSGSPGTSSVGSSNCNLNNKLVSTKKNVFRTPLAKPVIKDSIHEENVDVASGESRQDVPSVSKKPSRKKPVKSMKVNYFKELKNVIVSETSTKKLTLWGCDEASKNNHIIIGDESASTGSSTQSPEESSAASKAGYDSRTEKSVGGKERSVTVGRVSGQKKGRYHCGVLSCVPCSVTSNCGVCHPCVNKKLK